MNEQNDWGERFGDWVFTKPYSRLLCSESRTLRMLAWTLTFPWLILMVIPLLGVMAVSSFQRQYVSPAWQSFYKVWAGPVCEENENAGS